MPRGVTLRYTAEDTQLLLRRHCACAIVDNEAPSAQRRYCVAPISYAGYCRAIELRADGRRCRSRWHAKTFMRRRLLIPCCAARRYSQAISSSLMPISWR